MYMDDMTKEEAKYFCESRGIIFFDLEELFEIGALRPNESGFFIEDENL